MLDFLRAHLFTSLISLIPIGVVAALCYQATKKYLEDATTLLDKTPSAMHTVIFGISCAAVMFVCHLIGFNVTCPPDDSCIASINNSDFWSAAIKWGIVAATGLLTHKTVLQGGDGSSSSAA